MTELVSFVIPTYGSSRTIEACVASALRQRGPSEVIVVDNHSDDGTAALALAAGASQILLVGPERSAQRNAGMRASQGSFVVFIDSDMVLEAGLADAVRRGFEDPNIGALVLPERSFGEGYLAACRALEKRSYLGDPTAEAARAFRRSVLDRLGGYDEELNAFEDYELADRVKGAGHTVGRADVGVWHDEGRVRPVTLFRKKMYYGSLLAAARHPKHGRAGLDLGGRGTKRLTNLLVRSLSDPVHLPGLVMLKAVDLGGISLGHLTSGHRRPPLSTLLGRTDGGKPRCSQ